MKKWFAYVWGNPMLVTSYFETSVKPEFSVGKNVAAIYARGDGDRPDELSMKFKKHISDALASGVSQPSLPAETLVFMKS